MEPEGEVSQDSTLQPRFGIVTHRQRNTKKLFSGYTETEMTVNPAPEDADPEQWVSQLFTDVVNFAKVNLLENEPGYLGISLSDDKQPSKAFNMSVRRSDQVNADAVMKCIEKVMQSNQEFLIGGPIKVNFVWTKEVSGSCHKPCDACRNNKGIIEIKNRDNLCLPRAIAVGKAKVDGDVNYTTIRRSEYLQKQKALALCQGQPKAGYTIDDVRRFDSDLKGYAITVFGDHTGKHVLYASENKNGKPIDVIYHQGHFNCIVDVHMCFKCTSYCRQCHRPSSHKKEFHKCESVCPKCHLQCVKRYTSYVHCRACNRDFKGPECFANHAKKGVFYPKALSVCDVEKVCFSCNKLVNLRHRKGAHQCGEIFCSHCKKHVNSNHMCYIQPYGSPSKRNRFVFMFIDFECTQNTAYMNKANTYEHVPNLCVLYQACPMCIDEPEKMAYCSECGTKEHVFATDPVRQLFDHMRHPRFDSWDVILLAHNFRSYDGCFLLRYMVETLKWTPELIMNGTKIYQMKYGDFTFLDSLNFIPMPLARFSKTFGLKEVKGYFPYLFNTKENEQYVGSIPDKKYYCPEGMSAEGCKAFEKWHEEQSSSGYVFDMKRDMVEYCKMDVFLLSRGVAKFRREFLDENGIDPFRECVTIAQACMCVYRKRFMPRDKIALLPPGGYRLADKQSRIACIWLSWLEARNSITIQHALRGREVKVLGHKVDGYREDGDVKRTYFFNGCWYHGCERCFHNRHAQLYNTGKETMALRFENTQRISARIRDAGYEVVEMWECDFAAMAKADPELAAFIKAFPHPEPLNPRDAFYGGRTNCTKTYREASGDSKMFYLDICSLYPFVNKTKPYPVGHPKIHTDRFPNLEDVEGGLIKCTVLPPNDLYHPVLPVRINGKLMFPLCRACAEDESAEECRHPEDERCLTGTWVVDEVKVALEEGYRLLRVFEIWEYDMVQHDPASGAKGLFEDYVNQFLKIKTEASGWPSDCDSAEKKEEHVRRFLEREGVALDPEAVAPNPGRRELAKLMLNSFWGKYGQRNNLPTCELVDRYDRLIELLNDPAVEVQSYLPATDDVMVVVWRYVDQSPKVSPTSNAVVAAYTTAHARLQLYGYLRRLGDRVCYFDTDSVIATYAPGQWMPPVGPFLGDMTDELEKYGRGAYVSRFASTGPKSYCLEIKCPETGDTFTVCKVKGITLNSGNSERVNADVIRDAVLRDNAMRVTLRGTQISRKPHWTVVTEPSTKTFRMVVNKRVLADDFDSFPYGYKRMRT